MRNNNNILWGDTLIDRFLSKEKNGYRKLSKKLITYKKFSESSVTVEFVVKTVGCEPC